MREARSVRGAHDKMKDDAAVMELSTWDLTDGDLLTSDRLTT